MINLNMTLSPRAEFAMPVSGSGLVAAVRALPSIDPSIVASIVPRIVPSIVPSIVPGLVLWGAVSAAAGAKHRFLDNTPVCGYSRVTDVAVLTGAFPGTSAWSPPI